MQLIDPRSEKILDDVTIGKSWYGLQFSADDKKLYVSAGNDNMIVVYPIKNNKFGATDTFFLNKRWPVKVGPTGLDVDNNNNRLYVVTKEDNTLYVIDMLTKRFMKTVQLGHEAYACLLSPDKKYLYISLWGGDSVAVFNTVTMQIEAHIPTQSHPNEMVYAKKQNLLYVANANDNSVSVINARSLKVIETISAAVHPTKLAGSTTNGLALSPNEKTLYIANADNNCLAVFNVSLAGNSISKGFVPTGWYPTNVVVYKKKILVSNGKGFVSMANPNGPQPIKKTDNSGYQKGISANMPVQYIGGLFHGTLSVIDVPNEARLATFTNQVYANMPYNLSVEQQPRNAEANNPVPAVAGAKSPIKHVFYVIKENRTYDQVLGDMPEGNGDSSLCIFPENITPNHHALAREFVLLDNFYVDAEVSADGHNWSMGGYATDYVEKTWPTSYGGRGGTYDYEGTRKIAFPRDGFIWNYCNRAGLSYRTYGEFGSFGKANIKVLEGHVCAGFSDFNMDVLDVDRVAAFKKDFDSLLAIQQVPQFNTIRLSSDHTSGQAKGKYSPLSALADNDLALGQLVQHISESPIWKESAIFVLEDDAQNGPDHVDAHRSPAFVISPYVKRRQVNHTMYSTSGFLRTMELILGLPAMSQYDAAALPLYSCFTSSPDFTPYRTKQARRSIIERNTADNGSARISATFNLAREDAAPDLLLNEVIWKSVKGEDAIMPAPRRSAFVKLEKKKDNDD